MRVFSGSIWLLAVAGFVSSSGVASPAVPPAVVFRNVRVLDGTGAPPREHVTVVVENGLISQVCEAGSPCHIPAGAVERKDLAGDTVMPALIAGHAHLALLNGQGQFDASEYTEPNVLAELQQFQRFGVTTVVSLGANRDLVWSLRERQRRGELRGATLLTVGRGIGVPGGFPPFPAAPDQLDRPTTPEEAKADVDRAAGEKADLIKIWMDSNHGKFPEMSDAIARAAIAEAHAKGLRVAAHVYALEDARRLVNEGVDVLAHSVRDKPVDAEFIALLKTKGTWYIPTLTVDESFFVYADQPALLNDPMLQGAIPASQLAILKSDAYRNNVHNDPATAQHRSDLAIATSNLKRLYDAGVKVGFGTDSGAALGRIPGYSEHRELGLMVKAGLTPLQAIACATEHNGEMLRLKTGVVKAGQRADLLVVRGDPAADIGAVNHIAAVYQGGVVVGH